MQQALIERAKVSLWPKESRL